MMSSIFIYQLIIFSIIYVINIGSPNIMESYDLDISVCRIRSSQRLFTKRVEAEKKKQRGKKRSSLQKFCVGALLLPRENKRSSMDIFFISVSHCVPL